MDVACVALALWTLACHAASFLGGSLWAALIGAAALGALAVGWRLSPAGRAPLPPEIQPSEGPTPGPPALRWGGAAAGLGVALLLRDQPVALWWGSLAVLAVAAFGFLPRNPGCALAAAGRRQEAALWTLSLVCVVVALLSHRVDIDDAFYVNLALAAVEAPGLPVLAGDTLHGVPGLPLHMPVYRLHAWELWNAALALLTGLRRSRSSTWSPRPRSRRWPAGPGPTAPAAVAALLARRRGRHALGAPGRGRHPPLVRELRPGADLAGQGRPADGPPGRCCRPTPSPSCGDPRSVASCCLRRDRWLPWGRLRRRSGSRRPRRWRRRPAPCRSRGAVCSVSAWCSYRRSTCSGSDSP